MALGVITTALKAMERLRKLCAARFTGRIKTLLEEKHLYQGIALGLSLATDAQERVAMVQTFLALLGKDSVQEEHRLVVLNALFRPSSQTSAGEEGGPAHLIIDSLLNRGRSTS